MGSQELLPQPPLADAFLAHWLARWESQASYQVIEREKDAEAQGGYAYSLQNSIDFDGDTDASSYAARPPLRSFPPFPGEASPV